MSTIYFLDETNYVDLLQKYNDIQACVGIIVIDNYEELMQRATEEEKLKLTSGIEKKIYAWINKYNGLAIKSERDTYVCIFSQSEMKKVKRRRIQKF